VTAPTVVRPVYASEEAALKRAEVLKQSGIWPGAIHQADDRWILTTDPEVYR
jgi:hypothetical protein